MAQQAPSLQAVVKHNLEGKHMSFWRRLFNPRAFAGAFVAGLLVQLKPELVTEIDASTELKAREKQLMKDGIDLLAARLADRLEGN
jgi:hypothetical protein